MVDCGGMAPAGDGSPCGDKGTIQVVVGELAARAALAPAARLHFYTPAYPTERVELPLFSTRVRAGFPSPASDHMEARLDLNDLVHHREATYFVRVEGDSMVDMGISDGDILMVDKAVEPEIGDIIIAEIHGEFTVKRLGIDANGGVLLPGNKAYPPIPICPEQGVQVWGVVVRAVKDLRQRRRRR